MVARGRVGFDDDASTLGPAKASEILSGKFSAFWKMEEATAAQRLDSIGANPLSEVVGTVYQVDPGKISLSAQTGEGYLSIDDSPDLVSGPFDFFFTGWFSANQSGSDECLISSRNRTLDRPVFELWRKAGGNLEIRAHNGTTLDTYPTPFYMDPQDIGGHWDFILFGYVAALGMFIVQMNELTGEHYAHVPLTDSNRFSVGGDGAAAPTIFTGRVDACGYGRDLITGIPGSVLGTGEHRILWNYGAGQEWPFGDVSFTIEQAQNVQVCRLTADHAISATTKTDVPGMKFTLAEYTNYSVEFKLFTTANADTVGVQFALTLGGSKTHVQLQLQGPASPTSMQWVDGVPDGGWAVFTFDPIVSQGNIPGTVTISGTIETNASGGILQLQHGSETASLTTVLRGSWGMCARHNG